MNRTLKQILALTLFVLLTLALTGCQQEETVTKEAAVKTEAQPAMQPAAGSTADPPLIPHEVAESDSGEDCLGCHLEGDMGAPKTPHPHLVDCRQCHIRAEEGIEPFSPRY